MHQKVSFTSNINIVPYAEFSNLWDKKQAKYAGQNEFPIGGQAVGTRFMANCAGGSFGNKKTAVAFHYYRTEKPYFDEDWFSVYNDIFKYDGPVRGIITGGCDGDRPTATFLSDLMKRLNIDHSIIADRRDGLGRIGTCSTDFFTSVKDDAHYISTKGGHEIKNVEDLLSKFNIIKIADSDRLFINGTEVGKNAIAKIHEIVLRRLGKSRLF